MLDKKLKRVAFETVFRHLMHSNTSSISRTVRNLIEAAQLLSPQGRSQSDLESIQLELQKRIQDQEDDDSILQWLLQLFELSE